ncbi:MAG: hypothetical protein MJ146_03255 [Clostridia bacterium]|nr:hypothetical protein [Clostridia bacterium]
MKNLIVTIAIVVLASNIIVYQKDTCNLVMNMNQAKNVADEMARSAALCIDEKSLADGNIKFNKTTGKSRAKEAFGRYKSSFFSNVKYDIAFDDDSGTVKVTMNLGKANYSLAYLRNNKKLKTTSIYEYALPNL